MSFNLEKYLVENNLTIISRKRETLKEVDEEPTQADVAKSEKQFKDPTRDKIIRFSQTHIKPLMSKYKSGEISLQDYKSTLAQAAQNDLKMDLDSVFQKLKSYKKVDAPKEQD
jgi:hypothetical protein